MFTQVLWLLTWPALIILSYALTRFALSKVEKDLEVEE